MITFDLFLEEQSVDIEIQEAIVVPSGISANNYEELFNKPSINKVLLSGDKSFEDLGLVPLTNIEIMQIINKASNLI